MARQVLEAKLEYEGAPISLEPKLLYMERKKQDRKEKGSKVTLTALDSLCVRDLVSSSATLSRSGKRGGKNVFSESRERVMLLLEG